MEFKWYCIVEQAFHCNHQPFLLIYHFEQAFDVYLYIDFKTFQNYVECLWMFSSHRR
jgi:hypothetical protein